MMQPRALHLLWCTAAVVPAPCREPLSLSTPSGVHSPYPDIPASSRPIRLLEARLARLSLLRIVPRTTYTIQHGSTAGPAGSHGTRRPSSSHCASPQPV